MLMGGAYIRLSVALALREGKQMHGDHRDEIKAK